MAHRHSEVLNEMVDTIIRSGTRIRSSFLLGFTASEIRCTKQHLVTESYLYYAVTPMAVQGLVKCRIVRVYWEVVGGFDL